MSDRALLRIQAASGAVFLVFVLVHLLNTALASFGPQAYDGFQRAARSVYQYPLIEVLLVALPLLVHAAAAVTRIVRKGFRRPGQGLRARLHRYTGYFLLLVIFGHIAAVRGPSLVLGFFPEFDGISFSLQWIPAYFYPYYTLFTFSALYHGINGLLLAASVFDLRTPRWLRRGPGFWIPVGAGTAAVFIALLAMGGMLYDIPDPTRGPYAQMWRDLGVETD